MISVKIKIVPVSNHWLIYQITGNKAAIGRIRVTPNSIIFCFDDTKAQLKAREIGENILLKISSNSTILKSSYSKNREYFYLKWKTSEEKPKVLKCFVKYSRMYLTYNETELATTMTIGSNKAHIIELHSSSDFPPVVLLATLFPFIGD